MSVTSLCQICESATATQTCDTCGAAVCPTHYERDAGLCIDCASGTR